MEKICVIFDLDGTLVDSEGLCNQAFLDLLPELDEQLATLTLRYRGQKLSSILTDIEIRIGRPLPSDFEQRYRDHVSDLFINGLRPTPGALEMLEALSHARCIASSGPLSKIRHSLEVTGLAAFFSENLFSSYEIGVWKPDPGLFLHAATAMGFTPSECIVVEDSSVGIEAATAAGMRALRYVPGERLEIGVHGDTFGDMKTLPAILSRMANAA